MDDSPFRFVWPVDQDGYEVERATLTEPQGLGGLVQREYDFIRSRGGPSGFTGLWRMMVCGSGLLTPAGRTKASFRS